MILIIIIIRRFAATPRGRSYNNTESMRIWEFEKNPTLHSNNTYK